MLPGHLELDTDFLLGARRFFSAPPILVCLPFLSCFTCDARRQATASEVTRLWLLGGVGVDPFANSSAPCDPQSQGGADLQFRTMSYSLTAFHGVPRVTRPSKDQDWFRMLM